MLAMRKEDSAIVSPPKMMEENNLIENDSIKVKTKPSPDGRKTFISKIFKVT